MKPFKTLDEQITILENRGLTINDKEKVKKYLLSNAYYTIINGYSKFFQTSTDRYITGATFDEIASLYSFEKDIKRSILQAILDSEHHIKSILAHRFSEKYTGIRYAYLNNACYDDSKILEVGRIISQLSNIINSNKNRRGNNSIKHYVKQYNDVPIWVLNNYLEFGHIRNIIENCPTTLQNSIAKDLSDFIKTNNPDFHGVFEPETMISFLKNINQTRNVCAHNKRLLNHICYANSVHFPAIHDAFQLQDDDSRKTVYSTVVSLQCFISHPEFISLWNALRKRIIKLSNKLKSIDINIINSSLGFPNDWHLEPPLK